MFLTRQRLTDVRGDGLARVSFLDRLLEPDLLRTLLKPDAFGRASGDPIKNIGYHLRILQTHVVVGLIYHELLHHQLVLRVAAILCGKLVGLCLCL